jgi:hypothetical protein
MIHTCNAMPMPRPCHALTMPFFSRPRHSTAIDSRPVGYLPAFGFFRLPCGVTRRFLSEAYQSSSQRSIPTTVKSGSSTLQKDDLLNCWTSSSDISGYHAAFHEGNGTVGAWHGHGMLCVNRPEGVGLLPLACRDCGFESHRRHKCLSVGSVVCCQLEVSATS